MRKWLLPFLLLAAVLVFWTSSAHAQTPACDALQGAKRSLATELLGSIHSYDCCDNTVAACLAANPSCSVPRRLANDICRRAAQGQDRAAIDRELSLRAQSMQRTSAPVPIDLSHSTVAGEAGSRVSVVLYLCPRCPFCARLTPELYRSVTEGDLKGRVKVYVKEFPIRNHANSAEAAMGLLAAEQLGKFWPFVLKLYQQFDSFDLAKLPDLAASVGMDRAAFSASLNDPALRARLVESKKEGIRNKVEATPSVFINGRKYLGDMATVDLHDVLAEEAERP